MKKSAFFFIFAFLVFSGFAEKIQFRADSMKGSTSSKSDSTILEGNAFVKTETMEIKADRIEMKGENFRYILADGNVDGKNSESKMDFQCGKMTYDRETKVATLEDKVHLVDIENEVTADAQVIEYDQNSEIAIMEISVNLIQKDNVCTGAYAVYRKNAQILELTGNPNIKQGEDSFRAHEIKLNLETQEITLDSKVSGTVTDKKE